MALLSQVELAVTLTQINCGECGGTYAINERYRKQKHTNGGYWNCPYCRCSWGYGKSEIDRERERTRAALSRANESEALRLQLERKLKRVRRGVCPECKRSFQNLAKHMRCKHGA